MNHDNNIFAIHIVMTFLYSSITCSEKNNTVFLLFSLVVHTFF